MEVPGGQAWSHRQAFALRRAANTVGERRVQGQCRVIRRGAEISAQATADVFVISLVRAGRLLQAKHSDDLISRLPILSACPRSPAGIASSYRLRQSWGLQ